ncbi:MAG: hypothetical protein P8080_09670 [Gammaproteobacteria bacterium]
MRALLINPFEQTIEEIDVGGLADIRQAIGYDTVDSDEIQDSNDRLFFDEECFIRQQPRPGRFRLDTLPPVAGIGVVIGGGPEEDKLGDAGLSPETLKSRVQFTS